MKKGLASTLMVTLLVSGNVLAGVAGLWADSKLSVTYADDVTTTSDSYDDLINTYELIDISDDSTVMVPPFPDPQNGNGYITFNYDVKAHADPAGGIYGLGYSAETGTYINVGSSGDENVGLSFGPHSAGAQATAESLLRWYVGVNYWGPPGFVPPDAKMPLVIKPYLHFAYSMEGMATLNIGSSYTISNFVTSAVITKQWLNPIESLWTCNEIDNPCASKSGARNFDVKAIRHDIVVSEVPLDVPLYVVDAETGITANVVATAIGLDEGSHGFYASVSLSASANADPVIFIDPAWEYAQYYEIEVSPGISNVPPPPRCDLNGNGRVDAGDLLQVTRMALDNIADNLDCDVNYDADGFADGVISTADVLIVSRIVMGLIPTLY